MTNTQDSDAASYVTFDVKIDKDSAATPGDRELSQMIGFKTPKTGGPGTFDLWSPTNSGQWQVKVDDQAPELVNNKDEIKKKLDHAGATHYFTIVKPYGSNVVPLADLVTPPKWRVNVKIFDDGVALVGDASTPASLRVHAHLSFTSDEYRIFPVHRWPSEGSNKKKECYEKIYCRIVEAIASGDEGYIEGLVRKRYMLTPRLRLDDINQGEWLLPIFLKPDDEGGTAKQLLTYVKVVISWVASDSKPTKPAAGDGKQATDGAQGSGN